MTSITPEKSEGMSPPALAAAQFTKKLGGPLRSSLAIAEKNVLDPTPQTNNDSSSTTNKWKVEENGEDSPEKDES